MKRRVKYFRFGDDLHKKFVAHCNELKITVSEGVTRLLEKEIGEADDVTQLYTSVEQLSDSFKQTAVTVEHKSKPVSYKRTTSSKPRQSSRFSIAPYSIGKMTACPLCNAMTSRTNYSRHLKEIHSYFNGTEQFVNEHKEVVLEVLEREKAKQAT